MYNKPDYWILQCGYIHIIFILIKYYIIIIMIYNISKKWLLSTLSMVFPWKHEGNELREMMRRSKGREQVKGGLLNNQSSQVPFPLSDLS